LTIYGIVFLMLISFLGWPMPSYLLFGFLLLLFGWRARFYHPYTLADGEEIGKGRLCLGILALLILIASFIPVPISITY
jgi:hypothetical protein